MAYRSIQQLQLVLHTGLFQAGTCSRIHFSALATVADIDFIHIIHQLQSSFLANMLVKSATKIIGNIVFTIRESACTSEAIHNSAGWTFDAAFDFFAVNRTFSLFQRTAGLKYSHLNILISLNQLIGRKNTTRACTNNNNIVFHVNTPYPTTKMYTTKLVSKG